MNKLAREKLTFFAIGIALLIIIGFGITMESYFVGGATNMTSLAKVYISNSEPNITGLRISPDPVDLVPGNTTQVNCTASVWEYNGYLDLNVTNATLYHQTESQDSDADDNNYHYTNNSCTCVGGGSPYNASCTCSFDVWYYAYNGSWTCNVTVGDGQFYSTKNKSVTVNPVIGVGVPDEIDYGNMSVSQTSNFIRANFSNWGNLPINISIRGFGGTDESVPGVGQYAMLCELGNISMDYMKYSLNMSITFANMTNLTNTRAGLPNIKLPVRTNDLQYGNDTNATYWKLYIPWTRGGHCNGTVEFTGAETVI